MHQIANYDIYIFDCDGVILDSNQLKIDAMRRALESTIDDSNAITECVDYFRSNFGRSRFHHVDVFIEQVLRLDNKATGGELKKSILNSYSEQCKSLYLRANITPGVIKFINQLSGKKYIASGSEQHELRDVFKEKGLDVYFDEIYGSPIKKSDLVANILKIENSGNAIMFGDAVSDFEAACNNKIDFIGYLPYSNVKEELTELAKYNRFDTVINWGEVL